MKTNKKFLLLTLNILAGAFITTITSAADETPLSEQPERPFYRPFTLGLEAGSTGFGGSGSWRFADHWGVRAGGDYFSYTDDELNIQHIDYNARLKLISQPLTLDVYPWRNNSFHISLGIMFNENELTGSATGAGDLNIGGNVFPGGSVGTLHMRIEQQLVNPYLSIGGNFFYFDRGHHWAMAGELGVAYTGNPDVSLTRSGGLPSSAIDEAVKVQEEKLKDYADQFRWWPVVKLMVTYSF
jgi:hypothetical protein